MGKEQVEDIIKIKILELEDKLMDVIEISSLYEHIPVPVFEAEMSDIIRRIEYLETLI